MASNYVLVDFENVQPDSLRALAGRPYAVKVFVGAAQAKGRISFELSDSMQALGASAQYVRIARSGPNAVDMHIAYFIGRLIALEPEAAIYIVSKDTDFDPLVEYLRESRINCRRVKSIDEIVKSAARPAPTGGSKKAPADPFSAVLKHLDAMGNRPTTRNKLARTIAAHFKQHGGERSAKEIEHAIAELIRRKYVLEDGGRLRYPHSG